ncbi:MAG: hypothetical protein LBM69_09645 [Lachnospiraceae bacterium]|nr:hypothetical protein [Lachnospiraceae bacterium]
MKEFIDQLRVALNGAIPSKLIHENIRYYEEYIHDQVKAGKTQKEVLEELGDPRLLARTIIDTQKVDFHQKTFYEKARSDEPDFHKNFQKKKRTNTRFPLWIWLPLQVLLLYVFFRFAFSVFRIILPILLLLVLIVYINRILRK